MTAIDLSSYAGLTAMVLLTINILLGLLISVRYSPVRSWPHRRIPVFDIHNWTAYIALALVGLHPTILLFSATAKFKWLDILWPLGSPGQRLYNCFGALRVLSSAGCSDHFLSATADRTSAVETAALPGLWRGGICVRARDADRSELEESAHGFPGWGKSVGGGLRSAGVGGNYRADPLWL